MTREEFNKLPKQKRIDLVFYKFKLLCRTDENNKTRNITKKYARLNEYDEWRLVCTTSCQNEWFGEMVTRFFGNGFDALTVAIENDRKCFAKRIAKGKTVILNNNEVPDSLLETIMFDEIPNGEVKNEYLDAFDSLLYLQPFVVCEMSKQIAMDLDEYVEKSRENGYWLRPIDKTIKKEVTPIKIAKRFNNPKTLTKINIALICIAVFITIINILCAIC
jgi:hypothetical protein